MRGEGTRTGPARNVACRLAPGRGKASGTSAAEVLRRL